MLQIAVFEPLGLKISFVPSVIVTVGLIWLYTNRGGIKTIIWTDMLQTIFMLLAVFITVKSIMSALDLNWIEVVKTVKDSNYSQIFFFDDFANNPRNFFKMFFGGAFIAITMTGLDQDMMQKNLSCKTLYESQKNVFWLGVMLIVVNLFFLSLGALLYLFAAKINFPIPEQTDYLYPKLAIGGYLGVFTGIAFVIGLTASAYSSADSALTALTTSFSIDILGIEKKPEKDQVKIRKLVHIGMSLALIVVIILFKVINNSNVVESLFDAAKYTYGPLLGFYFAGLFTKIQVKDKYIPIVAILAPVLSYIINYTSAEYLGYQFGFELIILNGLLTVIGMWIVSKKREDKILEGI